MLATPSLRTQSLARVVTLGLALTLAAACSSGKKAGDPVPGPTPTGSRPIDDRANTVQGDEVRYSGAQTIEEYLSGRVPGLQVIRDEGGRISLRIRGNASAESEPLLIIDGTAVTQGNNSDALRNIDVREISRVEVLKDASQTAMYGSRGANGVVIVRLRKH